MASRPRSVAPARPRQPLLLRQRALRRRRVSQCPAKRLLGLPTSRRPWGSADAEDVEARVLGPVREVAGLPAYRPEDGMDANLARWLGHAEESLCASYHVDDAVHVDINCFVSLH